MDSRIIGAPPYKKPWPTDEKYDPELLKLGDKRNVLDKYRYWTVEAIKHDLDQNRASLHIAIENWQNDLNIGTIVRAANAFNVETVHIIGRHHWNRRGAMVTDRYLNILYHDMVSDFASCMKNENREIIAVDIVPGAIELSRTRLSANCVLVFGGEGPGLSEAMQVIAAKIVKIEQFGSTRSVNVGVAAGIAMYVWVQQNILK